MRVSRLKIQRFRGIKEATLQFPKHCVLVGDNNVGKSSVLEALDLVLGPERLYRKPPVNEHDFHAGKYLGEGEAPITIDIEAVVVDLDDEQQSAFRDHLEWWDQANACLIDGPPEQIAERGAIAAVRVQFVGTYDKEEDDFVGETYFAHPVGEDGTLSPFRTGDKRRLGFLFLRTLRTGSRALSLERGSLLDIILRLREQRLDMWEGVLSKLRGIDVTSDTDSELPQILESIQETLRGLVPTEWADRPHLRVSDLTRESLRKIITVFMDTGAQGDGDHYHAPFRQQGTGTINLLVLALLTMIAEMKQNVVFAMEEPETAIPPHTQKQIVTKVRSLASQTLFTSHSPYVLEEFRPEEIVVLTRDGQGVLTGKTAGLPPPIKLKAYRQTLRQSLCEGLLARRVALVEGRTELDAWGSLARRLAEEDPSTFASFESLGVALVESGGDSGIAPLGRYYVDLGKQVFALYDRQSDPVQAAQINAVQMHRFEAAEHGFENVVLNGCNEARLRLFAQELVRDGDWQKANGTNRPEDDSTVEELRKSLLKVCKKGKGEALLADFLLTLPIPEIPLYLRNTLASIRATVQPPVPASEEVGDATPENQ
jgi:putative ATP-dependent endonuclease of OLD family